MTDRNTERTIGGKTAATLGKKVSSFDSCGSDQFHGMIPRISVDMDDFETPNNISRFKSETIESDRAA